MQTFNKCLTVSLICFFLLSSNSCKKKELKDSFAKITFDFNVNINQFQCAWTNNGYIDNAYTLYFDLEDPNKGKITRHAYYSMQGVSKIEMEMGPNCAPDYCGKNCSESDRIHIQVGKLYQWKVYLVCDCLNTSLCGNGFYYLNDGTISIVHLLANGTIIPEEKDQKNVIHLTLIY